MSNLESLLERLTPAKKAYLQRLAGKEDQKRRWARSPATWIVEKELLPPNDEGSPGIPDPWQVTFLENPHPRKLLNIHRQAGKSTTSSFKCLHKAIFKPGSLSLIVAPALRQSSENFNKIQDSTNLLDDCPDFEEHTKLSLKFDNKSRIVCLPGGNDGATIRGFSRPDIIVEDESSRCSDDLYHALRPMMATRPDCELILASTPWGQRGHFYKAWSEETNWLKLKVVASECKRISRKFLEEEKEALGPFVYAQEFMGEFVASETQLISHQMIERAISDSIELVEI